MMDPGNVQGIFMWAASALLLLDMDRKRLMDTAIQLVHTNAHCSIFKSNFSLCSCLLSVFHEEICHGTKGAFEGLSKCQSSNKDSNQAFYNIALYYITDFPDSVWVVAHMKNSWFPL